MSSFKDGWISMEGITPGHVVPPNTVYGWGCRAIFDPSHEQPLDIVWDRCGHLWPTGSPGSEAAVEKYSEFAKQVEKLLPTVQQTARYFTPNSNDYFVDVVPWGLEFNIVLAGSPQGSGGYFYFSAAAIPSAHPAPEVKKPDSLVRREQWAVQRAKRYQEVRQEMLSWNGQKTADRSQYRQRQLLLMEREGLVNRTVSELLEVEESAHLVNQTWYVIACHGDAALCERFTVGGRRLFATADRRSRKIIRLHRGRMPQFWIPIVGENDAASTSPDSARSTAGSVG